MKEALEAAEANDRPSFIRAMQPVMYRRMHRSWDLHPVTEVSAKRLIIQAVPFTILCVAGVVGALLIL